MHVFGVQAGQRGRYRDLCPLTTFGSGTIGVVRARDDAHGPLPADKIGVAQPESLANPHARLGQQGEEKAIPAALASDTHLLIHRIFAAPR
jgi:hypothetical protein